MRAYASRTQVPVDRSKAEIERILKTAGASSIATLMEDERAALAFKIAGRNYRFMVPLTASTSGRSRSMDQNSREQLKRQRWRALALIVKAKLEAARSGIVSLETEMLPYAVLPGGRTVADEALPALERAYAGGRDVPLLPGV